MLQLEMHLILSLSISLANAQNVLPKIDAILDQHGAKRSSISKNFCDTNIYGMAFVTKSRHFLCSRSEMEGSWNLSGLTADGGAQVSARLGLRNFNSEEDALEARQLGLERYSAKMRGLDSGGFSWCYADAIWNRTRLWTLEYGCHISVQHVESLKEIRRVLLAQSESFYGAVGIRGSHSGWGALLGPMGESIQTTHIWWHYAKVVGVASGDTLNVRRLPPTHEGLAPIVRKLTPDATCIRVIGPPMRDDWWLIGVGDEEGYAASRFLEPMDAAECVVPSPNPNMNPRPSPEDAGPHP